MSRASTLVKNAALAMVGTTLLVVPVAAQQVAANTSAPNFAACDQIKDPAKSAQCYSDASLQDAKDKLAASKARLAKVDARLAAADDNIACAKFLLSKKTQGVTLDPTRLNREKGCIYARELGMQ